MYKDLSKVIYFKKLKLGHCFSLDKMSGSGTPDKIGLNVSGSVWFLSI